VSRRLVFHPYAQIELAEAIGWYEDRRVGLGAELLTATEAAFTAVVEAPHTWSLVRAGKEQRRCLLKRFPYLVVYVFNHSEVRIIAFAHAKREPDYWSDRG